MSLTFELEGYDELARAWVEFQGKVSDGIGRGVANAVKEGAEEARRTHRYKDRTGEASRQTQGTVTIQARGGSEGEIVCRVPYASFLDKGTKAHEIHARNASSLAWQSAGVWHFAKSVHHPGTKPDPFMGNAHLKAELVLLRDIEVAFADAQRVLEV